MEDGLKTLWENSKEIVIKLCEASALQDDADSAGRELLRNEYMALLRKRCARALEACHEHARTRLERHPSGRNG